MDMINVEAEQANGRMAGPKEDAFEESSGPIIYMSENRTPAIIEFKSTVIYIIYLVLILVLLLILPGIRRTKFKSFFCILTLLTVCASILLAMSGSHWLQGRIAIRRLRYSSLQPGRTISGQLEVNIGLSSVNVSLSGTLEDDSEDEEPTTTTALSRSSSAPPSSKLSSEGEKGEEEREEEGEEEPERGRKQAAEQQQQQQQQYVMYNELFSWADPEKMVQEHKDALNRGLPYPILTVTEYFSQDAGGFNWSRRLREAGHFASMSLCAALLCWSLTAASMCALPNLLSVLMLATGLLMMASVGIYALLIPSMDSLAIRLMGGQKVEFEWGLNCITAHVVGLLTIFAGLILFVLQENSDPSEQFTIMESERNALDRKALLSLQMKMKQQQAAAMLNRRAHSTSAAAVADADAN